MLLIFFAIGCLEKYQLNLCRFTVSSLSIMPESLVIILIYIQRYKGIGLG